MKIFGRVHYDRRSSSYGELDAFSHAAAAQVESFAGSMALIAILGEGRRISLRHKKSPTHRAFPGVDRSLPPLLRLFYHVSQAVRPTETCSYPLLTNSLRPFSLPRALVLMSFG